MGTQKNFTPVVAVAILLAVAGLIGAWFLYSENQTLAAKKVDLESKLVDRDANIEKLKNEKAKIEQELTVLKASSIAKEVELLRLKLNNAEGEHAKVMGETEPLEATMAKIKLYVDAVSAFDQNLAPLPPFPVNSNLKNLGIKIDVLNDSEVSKLWERANSNVDAGGDGGPDLIRAYFLVISKLLKLLP